IASSARCRQRDRLTGHCPVERPHVEVPDQLRRIECETPAAGHDAREVVESVEMAGHVRTVAEPDARLDLAWNGPACILAFEAGQMPAHWHRPKINRFLSVLGAC